MKFKMKALFNQYFENARKDDFYSFEKLDLQNAFEAGFEQGRSYGYSDGYDEGFEYGCEVNY